MNEMSDQQPALVVSAAYRRWAGILLLLAVVIGVLMMVAFLASIVLLVLADRDTGNAAYGYLALFLWFGIAAAIPLLFAAAIPGAVMTRRVRQERRQPGRNPRASRAFRN